MNQIDSTFTTRLSARVTGNAEDGASFVLRDRGLGVHIGMSTDECRMLLGFLRDAIEAMEDCDEEAAALEMQRTEALAPDVL
jgi:hypothetical protein